MRCHTLGIDLLLLLGLPDGADAKKLTNTLSAEGILTIQIPVRDYRPPVTPTNTSQQFTLPTNLGTNNSYTVGDQQLKLTFDLSGYKPDDVSVKVNDNVLKGNRSVFSVSIQRLTCVRVSSSSSCSHR